MDTYFSQKIGFVSDLVLLQMLTDGLECYDVLSDSRSDGTHSLAVASIELLWTLILVKK